MGDKDTYQLLEINPFPSLVKLLNEKCKLAKKSGLLTKQEFEHLWVDKFNIPIMYIIPKVHPPGRPIVSAIKRPMDRMGRYHDGLLKDMVHELRSYVQDTRDVLVNTKDL